MGNFEAATGPRGGETRRDFAWTGEAVEKLKSMRALGESFGRIAKELGNGCTRNMVCGKCWRMSLEYPEDARLAIVEKRIAKQKECAAKKRPRGRPPSKIRKLRIVYPAPPPKETGEGITLQDRTGCCWPVNNGGPYHFCDAPISAGDYCAHHAWIRVVHKQRSVA